MATKTTWHSSDIPDQTGRVAIVTGANSGLGFVTADALVRAGARVVLAVRDPKRGRAAAETLAGGTEAGSVEVRRLDLADLASVREFADSWRGQLDLLINNAGVINIPESATQDGFETHFGTNHLGHFALTNLLLPQITDRVVSVSSNAHKMPSSTHIHFDNPNLTGEYTPLAAYGQSKLANLLFIMELQRRLAAANSPVRAVAAHPGWAASNPKPDDSRPLRRAAYRAGHRLLGQDYKGGALPTLYAATMDVPSGSYYGPNGLAEMRGAPSKVEMSPAARDPRSAARLWALSEELTGIAFPAEDHLITQP